MSGVELEEIRTSRVLGVRLHAATMEQAVELCRSALRSRTPMLIGVVNSAKLVAMRTDAELAQSLSAAQLVVADGMPIVWASRLLGDPLPERIAGIDLMLALLEMAAEERARVYLLGARPDVLRDCVDRIRRDYPGILVCGFRDGYYADGAEAEVIEGIRACDPDLLFVGMPSPRKEVLLERMGGDTIAIRHGVGGSFDIIAGHVRRAPLAWQRRGFEWLYRLLQEPLRMWRRYLFTNSAFLWLVLREMFRPGRKRSSEASGSRLPGAD